MPQPVRWDIFCRVVDNYGDAGVCWRLARQLAHEHGAAVRLFIDDLETLARLQPDFVGVEVRSWPDPAAQLEPAEVVIEAFGCGLPEAYVDALGRASSKHVWIVLEYFSAEPWVAAHHGLPSPHPRYSVERYFFFPGLGAGTGGLLRESDLFARRDRFDAAAFWDSIGHELPPPEAAVVSLYAYEDAPLAELASAWEEGPAPVVVAVPDTPLARRVQAKGRVDVRLIPFLPQRRYDELLWACDVNFVRGEDSFVRAQWAARPFVWQIYPQSDRAHWKKLEAFLEVYCAGLSPDAAEAARTIMRAWNQIPVPGVGVGGAWGAFLAHRAELLAHGARWAARLAAPGDLAADLARFCSERLK